ncbi:MAG: DUF983 domain-containing protein [Actinomycetota bacterium]|nr:DUF983 domain-containing protein [Actinomycetota bacterium]
MVARGLARRCPRCGQAKLFVRWGRLVSNCPRCGHLFEREEGYWVGAIIINTAVTETLFGLVFVITVLLTVPEIPWLPIVAAGVATNGIFPFLFYPNSKTVWSAVDLYFHPSVASRDGKLRM